MREVKLEIEDVLYDFIAKLGSRQADFHRKKS